MVVHVQALVQYELDKTQHEREQMRLAALKAQAEAAQAQAKKHKSTANPHRQGMTLKQSIVGGSVAKPTKGFQAIRYAASLGITGNSTSSILNALAAKGTKPLDGNKAPETTSAAKKPPNGKTPPAAGTTSPAQKPPDS